MANRVHVLSSIDESSDTAIITDGNIDIARTVDGEQMVVGQVGRRKFQKIWAQVNAKGGPCQTPYNPDEDAPRSTYGSILPTEEELEGRPGTAEWLVVGVILAYEPKKYSDVGTKKNKGKRTEREARGILAPVKEVLRAVVKCTDDVAAQAKYYYACRHKDGLCELRSGNIVDIFFFNEYLQSLPTRSDKAQRRTDIGNSVKRAAAKNPNTTVRPQITLKPSSTSTSSNALTASGTTNQVLDTSLHLSLYAISKEPAILDGLLHAAEKIFSDHRDSPLREGNEGIVAFYDFDEHIGLQQAEQLVLALTPAFPQLFQPPAALDTYMIVKIQNILCDNKELSAKLSYPDLVPLLRKCRREIRPYLGDRFIKTVINDVLAELSEDKEYGLPSTASISQQGLPPRNVSLLASLLREKLTEVVEFMEKKTAALVEQHGGVDANVTVDALTTKIGNRVDRTSLQLLADTYHEIHAGQLAVGNREAINAIRSLINTVDVALQRKPYADINRG